MYGYKAPKKKSPMKKPAKKKPTNKPLPTGRNTVKKPVKKTGY